MTTDVATRPEFAAREATKLIDGVAVTGWFTEDLTLAELRTLRAKERIPGTRPGNTAFDGLYQVPTFDEVLDLALMLPLLHQHRPPGRGFHPETKHPTYSTAAGPVAGGAAAGRPGTPQRLAHRPGPRSCCRASRPATSESSPGRTSLPIVQLVNCSGAPYDLAAAGDPRTYADLVTPDGLREIATYADGIGACKHVLVPRTAGRTPPRRAHTGHR